MSVVYDAVSWSPPTAATEKCGLITGLALKWVSLLSPPRRLWLR